MGNFCCSSEDKDVEEDRKPTVKMSWERPRRQLSAQTHQEFTPSKDPKDYEATELTDEVFLRLPGQINDQRINIDNCKGCKFYLVDESDSVQVDDCVDCVFFIGPSMGSVFIRDCKNCKFVVACRQLRLRAVEDCQFSLFCESRPALEQCKGVLIGCYKYPSYFQYRQHMSKARLSEFNNFWSLVHDFTPKPTSFTIAGPGELERKAGTDYLIPPLSSIAPHFITADEEAALVDDTPVPYTLGFGSPAAVHCRHPCLVVLYPGGVDAAEQLLTYCASKSIPVIATVELVLSSDQIALISRYMPAPKKAEIRKGLLRGPTICISVDDPHGKSVITGCLAAKDSQVAFTVSDAVHCSNASELVFEKFPVDNAGFGSKLK